ncbi:MULTISPECIES: hypothetical protein [unclassified Mesorhizobium]|uniref:hypothetical protein n=1 Tax=unclassified Mesorhizobium TaxID=325217 RepID=UPI000F754C2D|nr:MULTISPECIES: hypothetical protein [unclassified Mesorhizobium]AZO52639.1 hypothetical protein EJ077_03340 [Mesorhizobium sp. M8A.F.Ca.ET.057.01.1.1]RWE45524.1 MAG: hypothetical protein EOS80_17875 [Mesorhizobium sp.]
MLTKSHIHFPICVDFRLLFRKLHKKTCSAIPYRSKNIEQQAAVATCLGCLGERLFDFGNLAVAGLGHDAFTQGPTIL